jgi:hypothetical protein
MVPGRLVGLAARIQGVGAPLFGMFGQKPINVFNKADVSMSDAHLVLHEVDAAGRHLRVVPFMDLEGGRLDYLRNDLLYFNHSLRWQREDWANKFIGGDPSRPGDSTRWLAHKVARLDAVLTGPDRPRRYVAQVHVRKMNMDAAPPRWSDARPTASFSVVLTAEDLSSYKKASWPTFDLPPGQVLSDDRLRRTHDALAGTRRLAQPADLL